MPNIPFKVTFECEKLPELGTMFKMLEEFPLIEPAVGWNESTVFDIAGAMEVKNIRKARKTLDEIIERTLAWNPTAVMVMTEMVHSDQGFLDRMSNKTSPQPERN